MSINENPVFKALNRYYTQGENSAQAVLSHLLALNPEDRTLGVNRLLEFQDNSLHEMMTSGSEALELMGLMGSVASNGMKNAVLAGTGDTHMSMNYDAACEVATRLGFELVHTFLFWPVDDEGVEITDDLRRQERMTVWAHKELGLALTIESYTGVDDRENYHKVGTNMMRLFFAWAKNPDAKWNPQANGSWDHSPSQPNWRQEYRQAQLDGDVYKIPEDLVFVGHQDVRDGLANTIEMMKLHGQFVTPRPAVSSEAFGRIYGVGFYTDYKRAEFLDAQGKYDYNKREDMDTLHKERVAALPSWFRTMMGV